MSAIRRTVLLAAVLLWCTASLALAASPDPTVIGPGDPRSDGQGPGIVGQPLVIFLGVVTLGVLVAGATVLAVRLTRDSDG
ncbi:MAG: hypothetical protein ABIZ34_02060 [Candidatus Limnocylindrales bacterium]